ncbi:Gfo/Idh/MocA family protein [Streptomyces sp. NPDC090106]|uniref:Gfo/Idh/MocA family protein n=1 Tax=Streptomyces sp. NPDC090106 TaxID=3365946 RepID=UPI00380B1FAE
MTTPAPATAPPLRIGAACTGWIGGWALHGPVTAGARATVTFVASRDRDRARRHAEANSVPAYGSWPELLMCSDVDAVYLATPNSDHLTKARQAVLAGKHVLCEKPLSCDASAVEELLALAARRGVLVQEAYHYRDHPAVARVLAALRAGAIGRVRRITVDYGWLLDRPCDVRLRPELDGGAFLDVGCYGVDLLHSLVPGTWSVLDVQAVRGPTGVDLESRARLALRSPHPVRAEVRAALRAPATVCEAHIEGTEGAVRLLSPFAPVPPPGAGTAGLGFRAEWEHSAGAPIEPVPIRAATSYHHQLDAFAARVASRAPAETAALVSRARVLAEVRNRMEKNR